MPAPKIKMDKSRSFSTIHGVRGPGDPHQNVHFAQDGLYYDAQGHLVIEHPDYEGDSPHHEKLRRALAKKIERHMRDAGKRHAAAIQEGGPDMPRGIDDLDDDEAAEGDGDELEPINLTEWAAGRQQVEWNDITQAIAQRFKKRIASIADAIPFLVTEGVVPRDQVAKKYKRYLD
jgi:hypothetical protein